MFEKYLNNRFLIIYLIPFILGSLTILSFQLVHLLGHDHKKDKDFLKMRQIEKKYFDIVNV